MAKVKKVKKEIKEEIMETKAETPIVPQVIQEEEVKVEETKEEVYITEEMNELAGTNIHNPKPLFDGNVFVESENKNAKKRIEELKKTMNKNKTPRMFGYTWNGVEYEY